MTKIVTGVSNTPGDRREVLEAFARAAAHTDAPHPVAFLCGVQGGRRCESEPTLFTLVNETARTAWIEARSEGVESIGTISFWSDSQGSMRLKFITVSPSDNSPIEIMLSVVPQAALLFIEGAPEQVKELARAAGARLWWCTVTAVDGVESVSRPEPIDALAF